MRLNSFRAKLALGSGAVIGLLLVGTGFVLWQVTSHLELSRLDRELRSLAAPHLERVLGGDHWVRLEGALRFVAGTNDAPAYILWVRNGDRVVHRSADWPTAIDPDSLPIPTAYESSDGPRPGQSPPPPPRRGEEISATNPALPRKAAYFVTRRDGTRTWRLGIMGNPYATLIIGADLRGFDASMARLRAAYLWLLPVALGTAGLGAWYLAQRALVPLTDLTRTAERVTARGLDQRIPAQPRDTEFNRLISVFNAMLDRLENSFRQATRFSADASHELKTPLARLQLELEQALQNATPDSPPQAVYSSLLEDVARLKSIVQKLLLLSLADAGRLQLRLEPIELLPILDNIVEDCRAQAPSVAIESEFLAGLAVRADADLLEQALQNLATNALKYNRDGGRVRFEARPAGDRVEIRVGNTGPAIPMEVRERIFERFFRLDACRSQRVEGVGLGLSLSREILRAHAGDLLLESAGEPLVVFLAWLPVSKMDEVDMLARGVGPGIHLADHHDTGGI